MKNLNERVEGSRLYASEVLGLDEAAAQEWAEDEQAKFLEHVKAKTGAANVEQAAEALLAEGYAYQPVPA